MGTRSEEEDDAAVGAAGVDSPGVDSGAGIDITCENMTNQSFCEELTPSEQKVGFLLLIL